MLAACQGVSSTTALNKIIPGTAMYIYFATVHDYKKVVWILGPDYGILRQRISKTLPVNFVSADNWSQATRT